MLHNSVLLTYAAHPMTLLFLKIWLMINGLAWGPHDLVWHEHSPAWQQMDPGQPEARAMPCLGLASSPSGELGTTQLCIGPVGTIYGPCGQQCRGMAQHDLLGPIHQGR
jgi:hypothetical protein